MIGGVYEERKGETNRQKGHIVKKQQLFLRHNYENWLFG